MTISGEGVRLATFNCGKCTFSTKYDPKKVQGYKHISNSTHEEIPKPDSSKPETIYLPGDEPDED